ncbi:MAG: hypothetical protein QNJ45_00775 [Ardenticatenaceae bacterium]|nr:hypothetical protein [Ardenticatenaceae bacterium]
MSFWNKIKNVFQSGSSVEEGPETPSVEEEKTVNPVFSPVDFPPKPQPTASELAAQAHWRKGLPVALEEFWEAMMNDVDTVDFNQIRLALLDEYQRPDEMALDLYFWYGHGVGDWLDYPPYETVPEQLLWELPLPPLLQALEDHPLDPPHLEGAARFFCGDIFGGTRGEELGQISADIQQGFLDYLAENKEAHKIQRLKAVFQL